jgi:protocatechuate 3,4-dioxygenase beta subunit
MRRGGLLVWAGAVMALAGCTERERSDAVPTGSTGPSPTAAQCRPTPGEDDGPAASPPDTPSRVRLGPGRDVEPTVEAVAISRKGTSLLVTGVVYAEDCRTPLAGATVDVWQTTADGRYGPSGSSATGTRCCYLQGEIRTDSQGRYGFDTVLPGRYAEPDPPPRHIHLAISHPRARSLTTELTFAGDPGVAPDDPLAVTPDEQGTRQYIEFAIVLERR